MKNQDCGRSLTASLTLLVLLLLVGLLTTSMVAQTPRAYPYMTSVYAGTPGLSVSSGPFTVGQACTSGGGKTAYDVYGDGCLATEAVFYQPYAVVFDSNGNGYIADTDPAGFAYVRKVDAVTGVVDLFAGGLSSAAGSGTTPCDAYSASGHTGPDTNVNTLLYANKTNGDGCPAVDPDTHAPYTYFKGIRDLAIDANYLYIDDSSNSKIRKINLSATPRPLLWYGHESEPVAGFGGSGWTQDGSLNTVAIKNPYSVTVDSFGNVFFSDQSGNAVRRATPTTYSLVGGVVTPTVGAIVTILNCTTVAATPTTCVVAVNGQPCPSGNSIGASRAARTYTVTGMAFDTAGNLYVAANHCYSVYKIANNGASAIDGTTNMSTLMGTGVTGSYSGGTWMQGFSGGAQSSTRSVTTAGGLNLYVFNSQNAWLYDAGDTGGGAANGWLHQVWGSATSQAAANCTTQGSPTATSAWGCPAAYSFFNGSSSGGKGMMDSHGNLYVADGGDALVLKAATGLDFEGIGPEFTATAPIAQEILIHGAGISDSVISTSSPFSLTPLLSYATGTADCSTTSTGDLGTDCTYTLTYTPSKQGVETGNVVVSGTNLEANGLGDVSSTTPVTPVASCSNKPYDGNANATCSCSLDPVQSTAGCNFASCSFASPNAGAQTVTCTGATLTGVTGGLTLTGTTATAPATIEQVTPALSVSCPEVTYDGSAHSCTGSAVGIDGVTPVAGSFSFAPGSETAAGSYAETGTFTSTDPNYASGGTATGTLKIDAAAPVLAIGCPTVTYDGAAHSCTASATGLPGVGGLSSKLHMLSVPLGAPVSGSFVCVPASETNAGSYPVTCTFTSTDPNYLSGGQVGGTLVINPATPSLTALCPEVPFDGAAHGCSGSATGVGGAVVAGSFSFVPGSETAAGSYPETGTFTSTDSNYVSGGTAGATLKIDAVAPALSLSCNPVTANGNPQACSPGGSATGVGGAAVAGSWAYTYNGSATVPSAAATYTVVGTFTSSNTNYLSGGTATGSFVIGSQPVITVSLSCPTVTYDGTAKACTATPVPANATCTGLVSETNVGSYAETATCSLSGYQSGTASGTLVINPAASTTTVTCAEVTYDGAAHSCTAASVPAGVCTGLVAQTNAGSYSETATCTPTNTNYAASTGSATLKIDPAAASLTVVCNSVSANGNPQACSPGGSATGVGGAAVAGSWTYTYNGSATIPSAAATYTVVGTFTSSNSNYTGGTASAQFVISSQPVVTVSLSCPTVTYDGTAKACTATPVPANATCTGLVSETNVGSYPETATCSLSGYQTGTASGTLVINPAASTSTVSCTEVVYDGLSHTCTAAVVPAGTCTGLVAHTNAGSYSETATCTPTNTNYAASTGSATLKIDPASPALTVTCNTLTANGNPQACSPGGAALGIGGVTVPGSWSYTYNGSATVPSAAATYTVVGTFVSSDPNYNGGVITVSFVIGSQPVVTVSLSCPTVTYDGTAKACTATPVPANATCTGLVSETNVGSYPETATCSLSGYQSGSASGTLVINPATPVVTVLCPVVNYDGSAHSCTATVAGVGGASVTGSVSFAPGAETAVGSYPETATFTSSNPNYTGATGTGTLVINQAQVVTASLALSTTSVTFANPIMLGQSSPAQYVQITSTGSAPLLVSGVILGGANPGDFVISNQAGTCVGAGASLPFNTKCNLRVVFAPTALGTRTAILYITDNAAGSPQQVVLSGTAISGAQLAVSATTLTFPVTKVNATAPTQYLTLKSTGYVNAVISGLSLSDAADFALSDQAGACVVNAKNSTVTSLVPGANCNIRVQFKPTTTGAISGTLTITDNTAATPKVVTLNGTGQ